MSICTEIFSEIVDEIILIQARGSTEFNACHRQSYFTALHFRHSSSDSIRLHPVSAGTRCQPGTVLPTCGVIGNLTSSLKQHRICRLVNEILMSDKKALLSQLHLTSHHTTVASFHKLFFAVLIEVKLNTAVRRKRAPPAVTDGFDCAANLHSFNECRGAIHMTEDCLWRTSCS